MITDSLLHQISLGREGKNTGFPMGLPKLENIIDGVIQNNYTLVFSPTGSGKTSIALYSYIYKPAMAHLYDNKFKVVYYSLEMSAEMLFAKLLSMYIFETYGIELSTKELLSRKRNYSLSDEHYKIVEECIPWLHQMEKIITIYDKALNADVLNETLTSELEKEGKFDISDTRIKYTPNDENKITLVVIDHLSLVTNSSGKSLKEEMDKVSKYLVHFRNICKVSPLVIMQANRNSSSMERRKEGMNNLTINDTKDTGAPAQDAEVILSLFNPHREQLATYKKYRIKDALEGNFRVITVLKNRYGESDVELGCAFYGRIGVFAELPKPDEIYDYDKYTNPSWLLDKTDEEDLKLEDKPIKKDQTNEEDESIKSNLNFLMQ